MKEIQYFDIKRTNNDIKTTIKGQYKRVGNKVYLNIPLSFTDEPPKDLVRCYEFPKITNKDITDDRKTSPRNGKEALREVFGRD